MAGDQARSRYAFEGLAVPAELGRVHDLLAQAAAEHPEVPSMDLMLNVVEHGGPQGQVAWRLPVMVGPDAIEADLYDSGTEFTPAECATMPDPEAEGGRGIAMAEAILDGIEVERSDQGNHWRLMRRFRPA
jgi:serine/threonine-protein kinase RsbW